MVVRAVVLVVVSHQPTKSLPVFTKPPVFPGSVISSPGVACVITPGTAPPVFPLPLKVTVYVSVVETHLAYRVVFVVGV
jgi:hypothetical protein